MRFFATRIHDEDMCFLRDLIRVMNDQYESGVNLYVLQEKARRIIQEKGLMETLEKFSHYNDYEIKDCYPSDRAKLLDNASKIFSLFEVCPGGRPASISAPFEMIRNMDLTREESKGLILKHFIHSTGEPESDSFLADCYLKDIYKY